MRSDRGSIPPVTGLLDAQAAEPTSERRDVTRNRAKLLAAAEKLVSAHGQDATVEAIAREAGLGVGTAYRHFASKQALLEALFASRIDGVVALLDDALASDDAGSAFEWFLREVAAMLARDRGLRDAISVSDGFEPLAGRRARLAAGVNLLVSRAKAAGKVRPDFEGADVPVIFRIVGAVADFAGDVNDELWRRYVDLLLDGIRPPTAPRRPLDGEPLTPTQIGMAMHVHPRHHEQKR